MVLQHFYSVFSEKAEKQILVRDRWLKMYSQNND